MGLRTFPILVALAASASGADIFVDDDAPGDPAPFSTLASDPLEDGSAAHPFDAIGEAIAAAQPGDTIRVQDGVYQGKGNRDLDFAGKAVTLRGENGAYRTVINAQGRGRGFVFQSGEGPDTVIEGVLIGNGVAGDGGGVFVSGSARPRIRACVFNANRAERGAAIYAGGGAVEIENCLMFENRATVAGGAVFCAGDQGPIVRGCTLARNHAPDGAAVFADFNATPWIANSILWDNESEGGATLSVQGGAQCLVTFSDVEGGSGAVAVGQGAVLTWGAGNIDADPGFVMQEDTVFFTVNYDFHLRPQSPCVDAGDPAYAPASGETDYDQDARLLGAAVDMGADEFFCALGGAGPDCNRNGIPDDCEHDCNGNGIPDDCDIAAGTSVDIGADGIPDECAPWLPTYVDDDAPNDPGPGDPLVSDPDEEGTVEHPFDSLQEAIDASMPFDFVIALKGTYKGPGNRDVDFRGKACNLTGQKGPDGVVIDLEGLGRAFVFQSGEPHNAHIKGFTIRDGQATKGGAIYCADGSPSIVECVFAGNRADFGGAVAFEIGQQTFRNCLVVGNQAAFEGGGVWCASGSRAFPRGCTIAGNSAGILGGGICARATDSAKLRSSIVWGNAAPLGAQLYLDKDAFLAVDFSDVQGGQAAAVVEPGGALVWGANNLDSDPAFADAQAGDYHITVASPCIDGGHDLYVPQPGETDIDRDPRIDGESMDMGADEIVCQQDLGFGGPGVASLKVCGGALEPGNTTDLLLDGAPPGAGGWLIAGLSLNPQPFFGGQVAPLPPALVVPVSVGGDGRLLIPAIPAEAIVATVYVQVVYQDPAAPLGLGISNAVAIAPAT